MRTTGQWIVIVLALMGSTLIAACGSSSSGEVDNAKACSNAERALSKLPPSSQLVPGPQQPLLDSVSKSLKAADETSDGKVGAAISAAFNAVEDAELTLLKGNRLSASEAAALDNASVNLANDGCSP